MAESPETLPRLSAFAGKTGSAHLAPAARAALPAAVVLLQEEKSSRGRNLLVSSWMACDNAARAAIVSVFYILSLLIINFDRKVA